MEQGRSNMEEGKTNMERGRSNMEEGKSPVTRGKTNMETPRATFLPPGCPGKEGKSSIERGSWGRHHETRPGPNRPRGGRVLPGVALHPWCRATTTTISPSSAGMNVPEEEASPSSGIAKLTSTGTSSLERTP